MNLRQTLGIEAGLTAIIGGGGKTTLLYALAAAFSGSARVIVCTTTHIFPPEHLPCLITHSEQTVRSALAETTCVCLGTRSAEGKFSAPAIPFERLLTLADYIFVEADGSKHLPLKAHESHEPVIPLEANQTILVLGASGFGKPISVAAHRPALYAQKAGATVDTRVTPALAAAVLNREALHTRVLVNQVETDEDWVRARDLASFLRCPVAAGALKKEKLVCL